MGGDIDLDVLEVVEGGCVVPRAGERLALLF